LLSGDELVLCSLLDPVGHDFAVGGGRVVEGRLSVC
jgi:hypothetical protein